MQRFRERIPKLGRRRVETDPLVKVAGAFTHEEVTTCLETLRSQGIPADVRDQGERGYEIWVRTSLEPRARLVLGLSGRSVIRVARMHREESKRKKRWQKGRAS